MCVSAWCAIGTTTTALVESSGTTEKGRCRGHGVDGGNKRGDELVAMEVVGKKEEEEGVEWIGL